MSEKKLDFINPENIVIPTISIRKVNTTTEKWHNFVDHIYDNGVIECVTVIIKDGVLTLENGKHRVVGCLEALARARENKDKAAIDRLNSVPARIYEKNIRETNWRQMALNLQHFETNPREYAEHIKRIMGLDEFRNISLQEVLTLLRLPKKITWLQNQLNLGKLIPEAALLVDEGKIKISSAYALGKLSAEEQINWIEEAQTEKVDDFINDINKRLVDIKKEKKGEKPENDPLKDIAPRKKPVFRDKIVEIEQKLAKTPDDKSWNGFYAGVLWSCQLDPETIEAKEKVKKEKDAKKEAFFKMRKEKMLQASKGMKEKVDADLAAQGITAP